MKKTKENRNTVSRNCKASRFYIVTVKCGHVRKSNYMPIDFPVAAANGKEAAAIARQLPRVKHDHKDAILGVREVTREEYIQQAFINKYDPFLNITNRHDHAALESLFAHRIMEELGAKPHKNPCWEESKKIIYSGKGRIRNPKKWARMNKAA